MNGFAGEICSEFGSTGAKAGKEFGDGMSSGVEGGTSKSEGLLNKLGGVASTVAKGAVAGFSALTAAVGAIGGAALSAYADYEQLVGGVDTLFGSASGTLRQYAADAYKSCGLSANQYMTQATSFAASLVSSCGGDTAKAAEYANMAMGDMSDNVNKMGSNMTDVQNAYQGFAKQNYTMLDNLKLGYGGTQEEMKRLIDDANELRAAQGKNADLTIDSYADVVEAIHTVQESMGIYGTTADEAATTISGSIGMAKAAWENFLTALGRDDVDFSQITTQLLESIGAVATNVAPRVAQIGQGIIKAFPAVLSGLGAVLAPVVSEALSTAWGIAVNALAGIGIKLPSVDSSQMMAGITTAMDMAKLALTDPQAFLAKGSEMIQNVSSGLATAIPQLVSSGLDALSQFASGFRTMFPQIIQMGGELLLGIVQGLVNSLPSLIEKGPQIISDFANGISAAAETLLGIGLQMIVTIGQGLINAIPTFIANIPAIAQAAWDAFIAFQWLNLGATIVKGIAGGIASIGSTIPAKLKGFLDDAISHAAQFVKDMGGKATQAGSDFLLNMSQHVSQMPGKLAGWVSEMLLNAAGFASELAAKGLSAGKDFLANVATHVSQLPGKMAGWVSNMVSKAGSFATEMAGKATQAGSKFLSNVASYISQLPGKLATWVSNMIAKAASFASELGTKARTAGSSFLTNVSSYISQLPGKLASWISSMVSKAANFATSMASKARNAGSSFVESVSSYISSLPSRVSGWLSNMVSSAGSFASSLGSRASQAGQSFLSGLQGGFSSAVNFVAGIPSRLLNALGSLGSLLYNSGKSLIYGLANGISSAVWVAVNSVTDALSTIRSYFPFSPAKEGPFSGHGYTTWSGKALMADWGRGMESGQGSVTDAITGAMRSANDLMASGVSAVSGSVTVSPSGSAATAETLGTIASLLESIRDKDGDVYLDSSKVSAALASRSRYAMAGRGIA